jgi:hypothetical protein
MATMKLPKLFLSHREEFVPTINIKMPPRGE